MWRMLQIVILVPALAGCSLIPLYSYQNKETRTDGISIPRPIENVYRTLSLRPRLTQVESAEDKASLARVPWNIKAECRALTFASSPVLATAGECRDSDFVALAISGGGSRAAIFSAATMFELQRYGLLNQVDLLSCVSGGCLTAAYYALSCDNPDDPKTCPQTTNGAKRFAWTEAEVYPLLQRRFLWRWFGNWFWPTNMLKFWFTHYDRTDIMAETISNNLYDHSILDNNQFTFRDLNPGRPNIAINATNVVPYSPSGDPVDGPGRYYFTFTPEQFRDINSDLGRFPIAYAVMASATFPGAFNYITLRDFRKQNYIHLLDGGAYDNLGLNAVRTAMRPTAHPGSGVEDRLVIIIDSYTEGDSGLSKRAELRKWTDYIIDSNFVVAYDTLLTSLRQTQIDLAKQLLGQTEHPGTLIHIHWQDLARDTDPEVADLGRRLNRIPTSLNITDRNADRLRVAAKLLVERKLKELLCNRNHVEDARRIRKLMSKDAPPIRCL